MLFISGPTASGKTNFSLKLEKKLSEQCNIQSEIINADIGQFYLPLSIGTAKPDWKNMPIKHHLFDIVDQPKDYNVVAYKKLLLTIAKTIWNKGKLPIVVGGSLFYIQSIFFPPKNEIGDSKNNFIKEDGDEDSKNLWERLYQIDPKRAQTIHHSDTYRIKRALTIWEGTGKKPSEYEPEFKREFHARIVFINLPKDILYKRINMRTQEMITKKGWIEEVQNLKNTPWEPFILKKKLIGYPEIFEWVNTGAKKKEIPALITIIQQKTRNYAKRQVTFWKKLRTILKSQTCTKSQTRVSYLCETQVVTGTDGRAVEEVISNVENDFRRIGRKYKS